MAVGMNAMILATDISGVPAELIKHLLSLALALAAAWFAFKRGQAASGTRDSPVNIAQPLEVKKAVQHVVQKDHEDLRKSVDAMRSEITAQFNTMTVNGQARAAAIAESIAAQAAILHEKINAGALKSAAHQEAIDHLKAADFRHEHAVTRIQQQIERILAAGKLKM